MDPLTMLYCHGVTWTPGGTLQRQNNQLTQAESNRLATDEGVKLRESLFHLYK